MKINEKNWVVRFFYTWGALPWKKPLIMVSCLHFLFMETAALITSKDIPALMGEIYKAYMFTIIVAGFGSSTFEAWSKKGADSRGEGQEK